MYYLNRDVSEIHFTWFKGFFVFDFFILLSP